MGLKMMQQTAPVSKFFRTLRARKGICRVVGVVMRLEALLIIELFSTDRAFEDCNIVVHLHVEFQTRHIGKRLKANGASKGFGVVVHVHMTHIVTSRDETLVADVTSVLWQILMVLPFVVKQTRASLECGIT